jgi:eukaryotic-like serine/threonine-protein kinase
VKGAVGDAGNQAKRPPTPSHQDDVLPTCIGPYRILARLGAGGMGVVYRARRDGADADVALKTVHVLEPRMRSSLRREVRTLAQLAHPGVVPIVDQGMSGGTPYYAMELLQGELLRRRFQRAPEVSLPITRPPPIRAESPQPDEDVGTEWHPTNRTELLTYLARLCETLAYVHGEGIVHRDLKPDNIFLRHDGRPVLMDFGLAQRTGVGRDELDVTTNWGTLAYIAPEQLRGAPVDARADLYAVGCMLYEALTGRLPTDPTAVRSGMGGPTPLPPHHWVPDVPPGLSDLALALLARSPRDRLAYAQDVADALRAHGAEPDPDPPRVAIRSYLYRPELVGRDEALTRLGHVFSKAQRGRTELVLVAAGSGAGKTRLAVEFAQRMAAGRAQVVTGECLPIARVALQPLRELLQAMADRCQQHPEEAPRLLGDRGPLLAPYAPALAAVPYYSGAAPLPNTVDARAARERALQALIDSIAALAEDRPLVLILDDLQWADDMTMAFLHRLSQEARPIPLLLLGTFRSEETTASLADLRAHPGVKTLTLERLDQASARAMVAAVLGQREPLATLAERVDAQARGNPFFISEYLRTAVDAGLLERHGGRWRPTTTAVDELPLPSSIRALVLSRVERIDAGARRLLEVASVAGRDTQPDLLAQALGESEEAVLDRMSTLLARGLLEEHQGEHPRFAHDQIREIIYDAIEVGRRGRLHGTVADALSALPEANQPLATIAHHCAEAGRFAEALRSLEGASDQALRWGAPRDAIAHLERALDIASRVPAEAPPHRRGRWSQRLADAHFALGDLDQTIVLSRRALTLLGHALPPSRAGLSARIAREALIQAWHRVRPPPPSSASSTPSHASAEAALAFQRVAEASYYRFDTLPLMAAVLAAANLAENAGHYPLVARTYGMLGVIVGAMGLHGSAGVYFTRARQSAEAIDDVPGLTYALYAEASWLCGLGRWDAMHDRTQKALSLARSMRDVHEVNMALTVLGHWGYFRGDHEAALRSFQEMVAGARVEASTQHLIWGLYAQSRSLIRIGQHERALTLCLEAAQLLERHPETSSEIINFGLMALAHHGLGNDGTATEALREADARIRRHFPNMVFTLPGYDAVAEVALSLIAQPSTRHDRRELLAIASRAVRCMRLLATTHPIAGPAAALHLGRQHLAHGHGRRARRALLRARHLAGALQMPHEAARASAELQHT